MLATPTPMSDHVTDDLRIVTDLLAAAEAGRPVTLTARQCLILAERLTRRRDRAVPYLEAIVDQAGGRVHIETRFLEVATGDRLRHGPDHDRGRGHAVWIRRDGEP